MSSENPLSRDVQELIRQRIHSFEELEAIVLLRTDPARLWSVLDVSSRLRIAEQSSQSALTKLVRSGLAHAREDKYQYASESDDDVRALSSAYEQYRVEILVLISTQAMNRVRDGALRAFSEAFLLGGPKKNG